MFAAGTVVLFFGSILAHELGHSLVAQRNGIGVRAITLWFLGGVAELEREADDPGVEFRIAIAGPAVSMVLGVGFGLLALASSVFVGGGLLTASFGYLALINVVFGRVQHDPGRAARRRPRPFGVPVAAKREPAPGSRHGRPDR